VSVEGLGTGGRCGVERHNVSIVAEVLVQEVLVVAYTFQLPHSLQLILIMGIDHLRLPFQ